MSSIETKTYNLLSNTITNLGYEIYDIEYVKEGKNYILRIYIDNEKGIDLNDCEKVSNSISDILDKEDYIKEQYFLEVSSPGIERILKTDKHLKDNINSKISIKLYKQYQGKKEIISILEDFDNENITVNFDGEAITIPRKDIAQIKTVYDF